MHFQIYKYHKVYWPSYNEPFAYELQLQRAHSMILIYQCMWSNHVGYWLSVIKIIKNLCHDHNSNDNNNSNNNTTINF